MSRRRPRRPRRTWPQRLVIAFNSVLVVVCFAAAASLSYVQQQVEDVPRVSIGGVLDDKPVSGEPQNILVVGVDDGSGLAAGDPVLIGRGRTLNTDTIMVLRVDPGSGKAALLSFPRDLWVPIAGTSSKAKINSALPLGGPERLIQTIQQNFGIPIHHYVQVDFAGFKELVAAIDGVPIYFPWPARDRNTGLAVDEPGCVTLDPDQALAFARSRYFEVREGGRWKFDVSSDWGRINRQQMFIRAAMKRAVAKGIRNPFTLNQLIGIAQQSVTLDDQLTTEQIVELGTRFRDFDPDELVTYTVPGRDGKAGAADVVFIDEKAAQPIFDLFRGVDPELNIIPTVRVEVRNGSGRAGQGRKALNDLSAWGFVTVRSTDARDFRFPGTVILYAPGREVAAANVARFVGGDPVFEEDPGLPDDVHVALVTGGDFGGILSAPRPIEDFDGFLATTTTTSPASANAPSGAQDPGGTTTTALGDVPAAPEGVVC
jgi:LCP family protein required for cell wall assembly